MSENVAKAQLLNFILSKKYGAEVQRNPIIENHCKALDAPAALSGFGSDLSQEELERWLAGVESILPIQDEKIQDLVFGMLYSSDLFPKLLKSKSFKPGPVSELYKSRFEANKKYLAEFNSKDQGKIKINMPKVVVTRFPPEPSGSPHRAREGSVSQPVHGQRWKDAGQIRRHESREGEQGVREFYSGGPEAS